MNWYEVLTALLFGLGVVAALGALVAAITCIDADRTEQPVRVRIAVSCALLAAVMFALTAGLVA